ncbi:abhydrolase domain-containing 18 [Mucilaginibacter achroorhodeus]|uniref:Abhydrolase domain-containing 18 n=1 Tax=Mucilaginibacter achroorhodeus TaxID=2599294 RepID=A0A563U9Y7_9SPHI|nr:alpha/beta fold hydrolase [Mucilaginibacter achroorhodeus]TWR28202.1 abhydrolase domain-containing 18 [Mucilaginibacter achroorhodeus]
MKEQYHRWHSPNLNLDVEMLVFGDRGYPVLLFPTTKGAYYQNKDHGLIDSVRWFIDEGLVKIYCPSTFDDITWYDKGIHPADRARRYAWYNKMLLEELAPWAMHETGVGKVAVAGCSFGGYHAANFAFKHPEKVGHLFSMGGAFDIRMFTDGYYDDNIFYNNPVDYLPRSDNWALWQMNIILGTSDWDICKEYNLTLSHILNNKNINHWLDIRPDGKHDWPIWKEMFSHYLSTIK